MTLGVTDDLREPEVLLRMKQLETIRLQNRFGSHNGRLPPKDCVDAYKAGKRPGQADAPR